jgi:hypothetical protein
MTSGVSVAGVGSDEAVERTSEFDAPFVLTRTEKGCVVVDGAEAIVQDACPVDEVTPRDPPARIGTYALPGLDRRYSRDHV